MLKSKPMVPGDMLLFVIGYKYNSQKVLYFVVTDNTGITNAGINYLYKNTDPFYNVTICPFAHPLSMYKFFGYVNEVGPHNKQMYSDLALEIFWVTQCGWIR